MARRKAKGVSGFTGPQVTPGETLRLDSALGFDYKNPSEWYDTASEPLAPIVGREYDERQMPVDWDYKTAITGPNGEALPDQAQGWNFFGKPDFGPGLGAWWKRATWKFTQDQTEVLENSPTLKSLTDGVKETWDFWSEEVDTGKAPLAKAVGQTLLSMVGGIAQGIGAAWRQTETAGPDGNGVTVWNAIPRAVGVAFDTLGYGFETLDRAMKENVVVPRALAASRALRENNTVSQETMDGWRNWIGPLGLFPLWARAGFAAVTGEIDIDALDTDRDLLASRLGYTAWKEEATKEEFLRRIASGEDPRLLAMELQDPINEMAAEFLFDPLNIVSLGGKALLTRAKDARKWYRAGRIGDKAADFIRIIEKADDISKPLREAEFFKWVDNLALGTATDLAGDARVAGDWGGLKGLFTQTADSRRALITEEMSDVLHELVVLTDSPDDTMRVLRSLSTLLDPDAGTDARKFAMREINFGIGGRKVPLSTLFGEKGQRTALVWRKMMGNDDGARLIELMKENTGDIIKMNEALGAELKKITDGVFPTIKDRVVQNGKYNDLIKADKAEDAAALLKKKPWAETPPNALHANLLKIYEPLQNKFYKPAGAIQGTMFMGLNPAYRMRNRMGNFAVLFVDQGPSAAFSALLDNRLMPWGKNWAVDTLNNWSGEVGHAAEFRGIGKQAAGAAASFDNGKWMKGKLNYFATGASADEAVAGVHVMSRVMKRVVRGVLNRKKALVGLDDLVKTPDDAKLIERLTKNNYGDVEKALRQFADQKGIDNVSNLLFMNSRQEWMVNRLEIGDSLRAALDPSLTRKEQVARLDEIIESHRQLGSKAAGESVLRNESEFMDDIAFIEEIAGDDDILGGLRGAEAGDAFERKLSARQAYAESAEDALDSSFEMLQEGINSRLIDEARAAGVDEKLAANAAANIGGEIITKAKDGARRLIRGNADEAKGPISKGMQREMADFRTGVVKLRNEIQSMDTKDLQGAWIARRGWMGDAPDVENITQASFRAAMWKGYVSRVARKWNTAFSTQAEFFLKAFDDFIEAVDPDDVGKLRSKIEPLKESVRRKGSVADAMFRAEMDNDGFMVMRVTPDEIEDMVIDEWARLNKVRPDADPEGLAAGATSIRTYINELRLRAAAGDLNLEDLAGDPVIVKAFENIAGSRAKRTDLLEALVSKEPDDLLTIDNLKARRQVFIESATTKESVGAKIKEIQTEIDRLGSPARTVEDVDVGTRVFIGSKQLEDVVVIERYTTKGGTAKVAVQTPDGQTLRVNLDQVQPTQAELTNAMKLDELRSQEKLLGDALDAADEGLDEFTAAKVSELDQRISEIEKNLTDRYERVVGDIPLEKRLIDKFEDIGEDGAKASATNPKALQTAIDSIKVAGPDQIGNLDPRLWVRTAFADEDSARALKEVAKDLGVKEDEIIELLIDELWGKNRPLTRQPAQRFGVPVVGPMDDATPTPARMANKTAPIIRTLVDDIKKQVQDAGPSAPVARAANYSATEMDALRKWATEAQGKVNQARSVGGEIASAARDFGLHNYGKRYGFDLVAGLIYPYQFWYSRSYVKWMKRLVQNPQVLSGYLRYRRTLEKLHAGMPEWWKYQLNTNELLGLDSENPLYFNLEAMVNPLNGLTNVDFTDPERRKDWWGAAMEDIQKMGPSVWTPFTFALAAYYSFKGEKEAAARWAGRLLPQSRTFRDVTALLDPKGLGVEADPNVLLFGGGTEAYERGRVGRQLGMMLNEGKWKPEDIIDAGYKQSGEIWDLARARAINDRAGNLARISGQFMFGVGLKPRPAADIQIDNMYREMRDLISQRPNMDPQRYAQAWNVLREAYPFLDTVLLSKKTGLARDEALAWNVLNRIPPGMSFKLAEQVNLDFDTLTLFKTNKGDLSIMNQAERFDFMGGVMQLDALLAIPDAMTAKDWTEAKGAYSIMLLQGQELFGQDIWDKTDFYYASFDENNPDAQRNFLRANPLVEEALDFKQMIVNSTPILSSYYNSAEKLERFFKGQMYQTVEEVLGEDIWDKWSVYYGLRDAGEAKAANKYFKDHPELKAYRSIRDEVLPVIDAKTLQLAGMIDEPKGPFFREENTMPDPAVGVQSFNVDAQQRWIDDQIMAYATGESERVQNNTDAVSLLRSQADQSWPNTRSAANRYYKLVDNKPTEAAAMLDSNPELEARIKWEFERVLRVALAREGELEASAAKFEEDLASFGAPSETSFENLAPGPLKRLLNDPDGLPSHLMSLIGQQSP